MKRPSAASKEEKRRDKVGLLVPFSLIARHEKAPDGTWNRLRLESIAWAIVDGSSGQTEYSRTLELDDSKTDSWLATAIKQIDDSIKGRSCTLVTCGPLHLRQYLFPAAMRARLELSAHYDQYIDLSRELGRDHASLASIYSTQSSTNTASLPCSSCNKLGSQQAETGEEVKLGEKQGASANELQHLSRQDHCCAKCSSLANLQLVEAMCSAIKRMLNEGHQFSRLERIKRQVEVGLCEDSHNDHQVVRARGLPWQATEQEIASFFIGLDVSKGGIGLCLSKQGRRNGEAFVRFDSREHRNMALSRHKHFIGSRYIEVYKASGEEFRSVAAGFSNRAQTFLSKGAKVIVRMRGLPFSCTSQQVVEFFAKSARPELACQVLGGEAGVLFVKNQDEKPTGDAFVLFETDAAAQIALLKHKQNIGNRYVELFRSTVSEVQQVLSTTNTNTTTTTIATVKMQPRSPAHHLPMKPIVSQLLAHQSKCGDNTSQDVSPSKINANPIRGQRPVVGGFTYAQAANYSLIASSGSALRNNSQPKRVDDGKTDENPSPSIREDSSLNQQLANGDGLSTESSAFDNNSLPSEGSDQLPSSSSSSYTTGQPEAIQQNSTKSLPLSSSSNNPSTHSSTSSTGSLSDEVECFSSDLTVKDQGSRNVGTEIETSAEVASVDGSDVVDAQQGNSETNYLAQNQNQHQHLDPSFQQRHYAPSTAAHYGPGDYNYGYSIQHSQHYHHQNYQHQQQIYAYHHQQQYPQHPQYQYSVESLHLYYLPAVSLQWGQFIL